MKDEKQAVPTWPKVLHGDAVRVKLPKARDHVQRTVTALVSELAKEDGFIVAWCVPASTTPDMNVYVGHKSVVEKPENGYWTLVSGD